MRHQQFQTAAENLPFFFEYSCTQRNRRFHVDTLYKFTFYLLTYLLGSHSLTPFRRIPCITCGPRTDTPLLQDDVQLQLQVNQWMGV